MAEPSIYDYIDHVFYINLDHRTDRKEHIESQFKKYGIDKYERFSAFPCPDFGILGCTRSHQAVYKLAKERKYKNVLIFEDDFEFLVTPEEFKETVIQMFSQKDADLMDVCMFAYNIQQSESCASNPHRIHITEASTASCYVVSAQYYDKLIDLYEVAIPLLEVTREHWKYANDQCWKVLQAEDAWYGSAKRMGKQMDGYSDNSKEFMRNAF
jgi:glycosyl transferase family 25